MDKADWFRKTLGDVESEVRKVFVGQPEVVRSVLISLACGGHVLLEGMPGLGKTLMVRTLAQALNLKFGRIQFTPDLMPADVTGTNILSQKSHEREFEFKHGPVFCNLLLADEINRATPKTQSALLEAMQEHSVTVSGIKHELDEPFWVMATQNPIEQEGTYPLPEAQLDRFMFKVLVPFPSREELNTIVKSTTSGDSPTINPVADKTDVLKMREIVEEVAINQEVIDFAISLIVATHPDQNKIAKQYLRYGSSPRGAQSLVLAAKAHALLEGRFNASKADLQAVTHPCLRHRIGLNFEAEADGLSADTLLSSIFGEVKSSDRDPITL